MKVSTKVRLFYYQCNRENIQNNDVAGLFLEVKVPLPLNIDNTFWVGYNNNANIKATPFLGGDGAENKGSNTELKYQSSLGLIMVINIGSPDTKEAYQKNVYALVNAYF